ncbi:MAG: hypothetical protein R2795_24650 [Saprospiraceae bacterium]
MRQAALIAVSIGLAHTGVTTAQIGDYEVLMYLMYLLTFFWVSGAVQGLLVLFPNLDTEKRANLFGQAFGVFSLLSVGIAALLWQSSSLYEWMSGQRPSVYTGWFVGYLATAIPAVLVEHFLLLEKRTQALLSYAVLANIALAAAVLLPLVLGFDFIWSFISLALVGVSRWVLLLFLVLQQGRFRIDKAVLNHWWRIAWPLALYALVSVTNQSVGVWMTGHYYPDDATAFAVYRYGARELPFLNALSMAVATAAIPAIAAALSTGVRELRSETTKLIHLLGMGGSVLMGTANDWFPLVFSERFRESIPLFRIYLLLIPVQLIFARSVLVALKDTLRLPLLASGSVIVHLLLGFVLGAFWGLEGIVLATVLAYATEKLLLVLLLWYRHGVAPWQYVHIKWWLFYTALMLVVWYWQW